MQVPIGFIVGFSLHIIGTAIGSRQDVAEALELAARGKVKCHHEVRDFKEVNQAMADLNGQKVAGRLVLKM